MADVSYRFAGIPDGVEASVYATSDLDTEVTTVTGAQAGYVDTDLPVGDYIAQWSAGNKLHSTAGDLAAPTDSDYARSSTGGGSQSPSGLTVVGSMFGGTDYTEEVVLPCYEAADHSDAHYGSGSVQMSALSTTEQSLFPNVHLTSWGADIPPFSTEWSTLLAGILGETLTSTAIGVYFTMSVTRDGEAGIARFRSPYKTLAGAQADVWNANTGDPLTGLSLDDGYVLMEGDDVRWFVTITWALIPDFSDPG